MDKKYIDADKLAIDLQHRCDVVCPYTKAQMDVMCRACLLGDAIDTVEDQPAVDIPRWIPVTERLPEEEGLYLVSGKWANDDSEVWICDFVRICNVWGWCNEASRPVIQAWMPLPTPYKSGEKE